MTQKIIPGGVYITFEGCECSGKSTQLKLAAEKLRADNWRVVETKEPGGTPVGAEIRKILLDPKYKGMHPQTESLLFWADRIQHHEYFVKPHLQEGAIILGDRDFDSSWAYQHYARNIPQEWMQTIHNICVGSFAPNLTILYDAPLSVLIPRIRERNERIGLLETRFDDETAIFHEKVRTGFLMRQQAEPERIRLLSTIGKDIEAVHEETVKLLDNYLSRR